jgi:hypothetical protein
MIPNVTLECVFLEVPRSDSGKVPQMGGAAVTFYILSSSLFTNHLR